MLEVDPQPRKTGRPPQPNISISDHLAEYCLHLVERKSPQGFGSDVAARTDAQRKCGRALVVRRLADGNDIVAAKRPVKVLDSDTAFLGHLLEFLSAADCILDLADALVSESGEHNERSHRECSILAARPTVAAKAYIVGHMTETDVRFGSKADIIERIRDVCFTPESGHAQLV